MRLMLIAATVVLAVPASAAANHQDGKGYDGTVTSGQGGTVRLETSPDGSTVEADFAGLGNVAGTCVGVGFTTLPEPPITNHAFTFTGNMGELTASGSFGPSFAAGGAQVLTNPCTTGSQSWIVDGPDGLFEEGVGNYTGLGALNMDGEDQTLQEKVKRGEKGEFQLRFANRDEAPVSLRVKGCRSSKGFKASYSTTGGDVTDEVTAGDFETATLSPQDEEFDLAEIDLTIKVLQSAKVGKTKTCKVTTSSALFDDVIKAKVKAKR